MKDTLALNILIHKSVDDVKRIAEDFRGAANRRCFDEAVACLNALSGEVINVAGLLAIYENTVGLADEADADRHNRAALAVHGEG